MGITGIILAVHTYMIHGQTYHVASHQSMMSLDLTSEFLNINVVNYGPKLDPGALGKGQGLDCDGRHCVLV